MLVNNYGAFKTVFLAYMEIMFFFFFKTVILTESIVGPDKCEFWQLLSFGAGLLNQQAWRNRSVTPAR